MVEKNFKIKIYAGDKNREVTPEAIRNFVKEFCKLQESIADARSSLKDEIEINDQINNIDEEIKSLKENRAEIIKTHPVISKYKGILDDTIDERRQLIRDSKADGIPRGEIDLAIKALKKDLDLSVSTDIYSNIADLID